MTGGVSVPFLAITLLNVPLLRPEVPFALIFAHHSYMTVRNRLTKKIFSANLDGRILARQIVLAIRFYSYAEFWQVVTADLHNPLHLACKWFFVRLGVDPVVAQANVRRNLPVRS